MAPIVDAIIYLALSTSFLTPLANVYIPDGFANFAPKYGSIALTTSGWIFVVAALSMYIIKNTPQKGFYLSLIIYSKGTYNDIKLLYFLKGSTWKI